MTTNKVAVDDANLSELLDRVERGEEIAVMRQGKVVATLVPAGQGRQNRSGVDLSAIHGIAERFRASVKEPFSSADINAVLYDADGLPK